MNKLDLPYLGTGRRWQAVKGELISRFGSVRAVAARLGCHPNSLRAAVEGACPGVRERLDALLASRESDWLEEVAESFFSQK